MTTSHASHPERTGPDARLAPYGSLLLRATLGIVFVAHALFKVLVLGFPRTIAFFESFGFPGWAVYPVFAVELLGGLALIAGFKVRYVVPGLLAVLLGAFRVHGGNGWYFAQPNGGWEYLAVLAAGLIAVALLDPGKPAAG